MARGLNKVQIIGNLGNDPEITRKNDFTAARISVATSKSWKDKQGNKVEHTEWHRIVFFNKLAEIVEKYMRKGSQIYVEGYLKTNKYKDKDGIDRYSVEIIAEQMQMLGGGGKREERNDNEYYEENHYKNTQKSAESQFNDYGNAQFDDNIPF